MRKFAMAERAGSLIKGRGMEALSIMGLIAIWQLAAMAVNDMLGLLIDRSFRYLVEEKMLKWRVGLTLSSRIK